MARKKAQRAATEQADHPHWAEALADEIVGEFPDEQEYVCAAGISPSGVVHFGNFREIMTNYPVVRALQRRGKQARLLLYWDDYDRLRKVPAGIDPKFEQYIGMPLLAIPDPHGDKDVTYAQRFQRIFEGAMREFGFEIDYRYKAEMYRSGKYDAAIREAIEGREKIAGILLSLMSDKAKKAAKIDEAEYRRDYYPVTVYSEFTGKDITKITGFDGKTLTYECKESGKAGTVELGKDHNLKLGWKIDWAMHWRHENITFEPGGVDHLSPGGPYDAATRIAREVFDRTPPVTIRYGFVGLQGVAGKMSGSTGLAKSPNELLEVYTEPILRWLYLRTQPKKNFSLAFDTEIFRQYDEFDREVKAYQAGELPRARTFAIEEAFGDISKLKSSNNSVPFRNLVGFGQIVQWDEGKLSNLLAKGMLSMDYDETSIKERLPRARNWLVDHNPDQLITLLEKPNAEYAKRMPDEAKQYVAELHRSLSDTGGESVEDLEELVYSIPKDPKVSDDENKRAQRAFFKDVYQLLIGKDTGPRLSTFLWAVDRKKVIELLRLPT